MNDLAVWCSLINVNSAVTHYFGRRAETGRLEMVDLAVLFLLINVRSAIMHYYGLTFLVLPEDCRAGYVGPSG